MGSATHPDWDPRRLTRGDLAPYNKGDDALDEFGKLVSVALDENSPPYIKHATVAALEPSLRAREVRLEREEGRQKRESVLEPSQLPNKVLSNSKLVSGTP